MYLRILGMKFIIFGKSWNWMHGEGGCKINLAPMGERRKIFPRLFRFCPPPRKNRIFALSDCLLPKHGICLGTIWILQYNSFNLLYYKLMSRLREHGSLRPIHSPAPSIAPLIIMKKKTHCHLHHNVNRGDNPRRDRTKISPPPRSWCLGDMYKMKLIQSLSLK